MINVYLFPKIQTESGFLISKGGGSQVLFYYQISLGTPLHDIGFQTFVIRHQSVISVFRCYSYRQ